MAGTIQKFDFEVDLLQAILWQYTDAPKLQALLRQKSEWYEENQEGFWSDWVRDVFDLRTANDFGLGVWARILGVVLVAPVPGSGNRPVFGFGEFNLNFNHGNFGRDSSGVLSLTTEQKRLVLRLRYFQLISTGTIPETNLFLSELFADQGVVYLTDNYDMTQTYVFEFLPAASVLFVLQQFDLLPRPAGVGSTFYNNLRDRFGFAPYYLPFHVSNFDGSFL